MPITREFVQSVMNLDLPYPVKERALEIKEGNGGRVGKIIRLSFLGETAGEPLISGMVRRFDVDVNILHGNIDRFKELPFGNLVVELVGIPESVDNAMRWLIENDLGVEVLK
jgi:D-methionine transport system ATP-binding protein